MVLFCEIQPFWFKCLSCRKRENGEVLRIFEPLKCVRTVLCFVCGNCQIGAVPPCRLEGMFLVLLTLALWPCDAVEQKEKVGMVVWTWELTLTTSQTRPNHVFWVYPECTLSMFADVYQMFEVSFVLWFLQSERVQHRQITKDALCNTIQVPMLCQDLKEIHFVRRRLDMAIDPTVYF